MPNIEIMGSNNDQPANSREIEKGIPRIIVEIIEYVENAVVSKTILKKQVVMLPPCHLTGEKS
jgi:hypothetical protein